MTYFVYIVTTRKGGPLHTDIAPDLARRGCPQREAGLVGFGAPETTHRGDERRLVYYEKFPGLLDAMRRERVIRNWNRDGKIMRIEAVNPDWKDLAAETASPAAG